MNWAQLLFGILLAGLAGFITYRLGLLTISGAFAAFLLGSIVFGLGGIPWTIILLTFFISSNLLSKIFTQRKTRLNENYAKGSMRDFAQVFANGGIAGTFVVLNFIFPENTMNWVAFCAAFAAANADTWATELGALSKTQPRLITTWNKVPAGTSGGISLAGVLASLAGAGLVALAGILFLTHFNHENLKVFTVFLIILFSGFFGSLVDSLVGASIQAVYWCPLCEKETEQHPMHHCGKPTRLFRGQRRINNDLVNLICTASAALIALILTQVSIL